MAESEYHVASYVLSVSTEQQDSVVSALSDLDGVEVHGSNNSKLVVTAEADHVRELARLADSLGSVSGVLSVSPVYHEFDDSKRQIDSCSVHDD